MTIGDALVAAVTVVANGLTVTFVTFVSLERSQAAGNATPLSVRLGTAPTMRSYPSSCRPTDGIGGSPPAGPGMNRLSWFAPMLPTIAVAPAAAARRV